MSWILTKSAYDTEYQELINLETGFTIRIDLNEKEDCFGIWLNELGIDNDYAIRIYHSNEIGSVLKVFEKICRKLNVQNEIGPDNSF